MARKGDKNQMQDAYSGFVGSGVSLTGNLRAPGPFQLNGAFHGEIRCEDVVSIGAEGVFEGDLTAREVIVKQGGRVIGAINADEVHVLSGGIIAGVTVRAARLLLERDGNAEGARFHVGASHRNGAKGAARRARKPGKAGSSAPA